MQTLNSYRKHDPVIYICQKNQSRTIEITAVNEDAEKMLGYTAAELITRSFSTILQPHINDAIEDMVEFKDNGNDVSHALLKTRNFGIVDKNGEASSCKMRVVRCTQIDENDLFQVVFVNEEAVREATEFREVLAQNFKGHEIIDESSGLPNRESLIKDLELTFFNAQQKKIFASLAIIHIDNVNRSRQDFGDDIASALYKHVASICRRTLRSLDTLSVANDHSLGCILLDTNRESARMACNRLRWTIAASPMVLASGLQVNTSVSIAYTEIAGASRPLELLDACEKKVQAIQRGSDSENGLHYTVVQERREGKERRQEKSGKMGPSERRKNDRRKPD